MFICYHVPKDVRQLLDGAHAHVHMNKIFVVQTNMELSQEMVTEIKTKYEYLKSRKGRYVEHILAPTRTTCIPKQNSGANKKEVHQCIDIPENVARQRLV